MCVMVLVAPVCLLARGVTESHTVLLRLEKPSEIIKSNHQPIPNLAHLPCPKGHIFTHIYIYMYVIYMHIFLSPFMYLMSNGSSHTTGQVLTNRTIPQSEHSGEHTRMCCLGKPTHLLPADNDGEVSLCALTSAWQECLQQPCQTPLHLLACGKRLHIIQSSSCKPKKFTKAILITHVSEYLIISVINLEAGYK